MDVPTALQMSHGALSAVDNAASILAAAELAATRSPTVAAFLTAAAKEELGKAKLLLEYGQQLRTEEVASDSRWSTLSGQIRTDHQAKLRAFTRWETELGLGPDPCHFCDLADPDCGACTSTIANVDRADTSASERQLALSCLYVDWDSASGRWSAPSPLAGAHLSLRHLLDAVETFRDSVLEVSGLTET